MRIVHLRIERFRSIRSATLFPADHNVYLGPNNLGKTAILEALNLLLNPEVRQETVRRQRPPAKQAPPARLQERTAPLHLH